MSQSIAIECHELVTVGDIPLEQDISDDPSNSCAFLPILVTELIAAKGCDWDCYCAAKQWYTLSSEINKIILTQPTQFNSIQDIIMWYDVSEAYTILRKANLVSREVDFCEEIITCH